MSCMRKRKARWPRCGLRLGRGGTWGLGLGRGGTAGHPGVGSTGPEANRHEFGPSPGALCDPGHVPYPLWALASSQNGPVRLPKAQGFGT